MVVLVGGVGVGVGTDTVEVYISCEIRIKPGLVFVARVTAGQALTCHTLSYDHEYEDPQPAWGVPHLNVTGPEEGVRECVRPEINACMKNHLRDGEEDILRPQTSSDFS